MSPRKWKARLKDLQEAGEKILAYCKNITNEEEFKSDHKTVDACIRNLQILGDAAKHIPSNIQSDLPGIPWKEIRGMRNILVHEYFGASPSIIWKTIRSDLPSLIENIKRANSLLGEPAHPWKICPAGEIYVRLANVKAYDTKGYLVRQHLRNDHCRESQSSAKNILTPQEAFDMAEIFFKQLSGPPSDNDLDFKKKGTEYDFLIRGWTQYWNEIFKPDVPLDADVVKALVASESSFKSDLGKKKRGVAKGLMQLMPKTIRYLNGYERELRNHLFEFSTDEVFDPNLNISAGVRWLFRKQETASARLKRSATWEEAVSEYKDYLHRVLKKPQLEQKGMKVFRDYLRRLKEK